MFDKLTARQKAKLDAMLTGAYVESRGLVNSLTTRLRMAHSARSRLAIFTERQSRTDMMAELIELHYDLTRLPS